MFEDIKNSNCWKSVEVISKGWSKDKKYYITTMDEQHYILRISDIDQYEVKKKEYEIIKKYSTLGITMSMPLDFGICNGGSNVYMLLTWVEGNDLEAVLSQRSENEQYQLGRKAGEILKRIHSIKIDSDDQPIETKKSKKLLQLLRYEESQVRIAGDDIAVKYVKDNIDKIWKERPVYMHGDYHPGNLIYTPDGDIGVIDFNRWEIGDPYEEFYKLESFGIEHSIPYCIGQIDAYFDDKIPEEFWITLAVYVAHASLYSIKWAEKFGQEEIDGMVARCRMAFADYDDFNLYVPKWYTERYAESFDTVKNIPEMPQKIMDLIEDKPFSIDEIGLSGNQVLIFDEMVLKIEACSERIKEQIQVMKWLQRKLPVPKVIAYEEENEKSYLLMSKIDGEMSCDTYYMEHSDILFKVLAEGLNMLWNVDIQECPRVRDLDTMLAEARIRIENGLVDLEEFEQIPWGAEHFETPQHLLRWLEDNKSDFEPVFSHGDYCLPNVFLKNGNVAGFIDLDRAGVCDKWNDIAICYRSLKYNFDGTYGGKVYENFNPDKLFEVLGIEPNWEKINYFLLLDEL